VPGSTFSYHADSAFIRTVVRSQTTGTMRMWRWLSAALAIATVVAFVTGRPLLGVIGIVAFLGATFMVGRTMGPVRGVAVAMHRQFAELPPPRQITVRVDDGGLALDNAIAAVEIPWSQVASVHRAPRVWWVHLTSGTSMPLPADAIPADAAQLIELHAPRVTTPDSVIDTP